MPSKLLIAPAEAADAVRSTARFGVHVDGDVWVDEREVMARLKCERNRFVSFVVESTENIPADERLIGYARFIDDNVLQVGDHTRVHAKRIAIATGSSPYMPVMYQAPGERAIVNDDVFAWDDLPRKVDLELRSTRFAVRRI